MNTFEQPTYNPDWTATDYELIGHEFGLLVDCYELCPQPKTDTED